MFDPATGPRLFALPPGADFAHALVAGIIDRTQARPPEMLADVTVYLNTARMLREVRAAFDGAGSRILPRLRLVTDLGRDPLAGVALPVSRLRRRLELAQLIAQMAARVPDFAPGNAIFGLAESLADLMAEMQDEGVSPDALTPALAEDHAAHWERSLAFIRIVGRFFGPDEPPDIESRQRRVIEALARRWQTTPPVAPVIVAGSTGSRGSTGLLLRAVAGLPQGAVVLPGFDFDMPAAAWDSLTDGPVPLEDHPQYRFLALTAATGQTPAAVQRWHGTEAPDPDRNRVISLSLRPAPVTDRWMIEGPAMPDLRSAMQNVALIEAPSQRDEAQAIALILRKAAEDGTRAALISPDRMLTRRVTAALDRWRIVPDDSAGRPLALSAPGRFLRQIADLMTGPVTVEVLLALLKHPLTATGGADRGNHLRFARDLELKLRRHGPAFPTPVALRRWAKAAGTDDRADWAEWLAQILNRPILQNSPLCACLETHLALSDLVAAGPGGAVGASGLWQEEAGRAARRLMDDLAQEATFGGDLTPADYGRLLQSLLDEASVRQAEVTHPRIAIRGTLEARVMGTDIVVLAGLNEGIWPAAPAPDPWLSRQMRLRAGLLLPERRIGLSAHDYQQAAGAPQVILSRATRDAEAETVPSRWLARLTNLLQGLPAGNGPATLTAMRERGDHWTNLAAGVEHCAATSPVARPSPRPPLHARPRKLPVTDISTLIRDPYAIYAKRILRLLPLNPLRATADPRLRGVALHRVVEHYLGQPCPPDIDPKQHFLAISEQVLRDEVPWASAQRLWLARLAKIADAFLAAETLRAAQGSPAVIETEGQAGVLAGTFTLTARPDRIDRLADGRVHLYDYKSGRVPSAKEQAHFDKQLLLEAAMAERGAFAALGVTEAKGYTYIHLGGDGKEHTHLLQPGDTDAAWQGLETLLARYDQQRTGYVARRAVFEARRTGDYDLLARYGEWELTDPPLPEDVG